MHFRFLIFLLLISCASFSQDSLAVDTLVKPDTISTVPVVQADTQTAVAKPVSKIKKPRKARRAEAKTDTVPGPVFNSGKAEAEGVGALGIFLFLLFVGFMIYVIYRIVDYLYSYNSEQPPVFDREHVEDQWKRMTMSRRDYYRNVYLKSEAWQRKRYVVLKRDSWTCVYCGTKATQVHHTRYAKWQIGKEPIEWLVSVCRSCHERIHE